VSKQDIEKIALQEEWRGLTTQLTLEMGKFKRCLIGFWYLFPYNLSRSKKEYEMLVTRKINVLSFFFGKPQAANNVTARSESKAQKLKRHELGRSG